jgi:hypothetical protein
MRAIRSQTDRTSGATDPTADYWPHAPAGIATDLDEAERKLNGPGSVEETGVDVVLEFDQVVRGVAKNHRQMLFG